MPNIKLLQQEEKDFTAKLYTVTTFSINKIS